MLQIVYREQTIINGIGNSKIISIKERVSSQTAEKGTLIAEFSNLWGMFKADRRRDVEERLRAIDKKLAKLQ